MPCRCMSSIAATTCRHVTPLRCVKATVEGAKDGSVACTARVTDVSIAAAEVPLARPVDARGMSGFLCAELLFFSYAVAVRSCVVPVV